MGLEKEGKIVHAKHKFYTSCEPADQTEAIDTIAAYGESARYSSLNPFSYVSLYTL